MIYESFLPSDVILSETKDLVPQYVRFFATAQNDIGRRSVSIHMKS